MTNALAKPSSKSGGGGASPPPLPPKPYTEYTLFFRLERTRLLQSAGAPVDVENDAVVSPSDPNHFDPVEHPRPERYARLALPRHWYSSAHKAAQEKKRKHRKREGRIDLRTLSKAISARWKEADQGVIDYCRRIAKVERQKYKRKMEEIGNSMKGQNRDDEATATDADAGAEASGGIQQLQRQQQVFPLPEKKPFVLLAQASKQQAGNSAPRSNGALSLRDFVFSKPERAEEAVAPEAASIDPLLLLDPAFSKPEQVVNATPSMSVPAAAPSLAVSDDMQQMRDSFNEVMGYGHQDTNQDHEADLHAFRLQAAQQRPSANVCGLVSPAPPAVAFPAPSSHAAPDLGFEPSPVVPATMPPPLAKAKDAHFINRGVRPENRPARKDKRRFVRRVSAPPEFRAGGPAPPAAAAAFPATAAPMIGDFVPSRPAADDDFRRTFPAAAEGGGPLRRTKRRASTADLRRELSDSFVRDLDYVARFKHVPRWEKEDADELLDLLDVLPTADGPIIGRDDGASEFASDPEMRLVMSDIGIGHDGCCGLI